MSNVPKGFEKPRRKLPNLAWLGFPLLVLAIFAFIILKVRATKEVQDAREGNVLVQKELERMRQREYDRRQELLETLRNPPPPIADEDEARDLGNGITSHDFAGLTVEYPSTMDGHIEDKGGDVRQLVLLGASTILITVAAAPLALDPPPDAVPHQRTIAGELRSGVRGRYADYIQGDTEVYVFQVGGRHVRLTFRAHGGAKAVKTEIEMVSQSLRA